MESRSTITQAQAQQRVAEIVQTTIAALDPRPVLKKRKTLSDDVGRCTAADPAVADQLSFSQTYYLVGVTTERYEAIALQAKVLWAKRGWPVTGERRPGSKLPALYGGTHDGFIFAFESDVNGSMTFGATSPCFWPNGTPQPSP